MKISYPYNCEINTKSEAYDFILKKCQNCTRLLNCSGSTASKCNDLVGELVKEFGSYVIKLDIPLELTHLAGNSYGREIYDTQIETVLNNVGSERIFVLEFPFHIEYVAIGFVQGIMYKWGSEAFIEKFRIIGNDKFVNKFTQDMRF